jgi:hypothetical protein
MLVTLSQKGVTSIQVSKAQHDAFPITTGEEKVDAFPTKHNK